MPGPVLSVSIYYKKSSDNSVYVANQEGKGNKITWTNSAYRTITLEQPATGDLLTWLQSNAVKQ